MTTTHAERVALYLERQTKERGLVQIRIWVPENEAERFKKLAEEARKEHRILLDL